VNVTHNVRSFGAKGDGVTDDAAALQAAINALPAAGGEILFPPGTYLISATLTLPNKPIKIVGAGRTATVIDLGANVIAAFTLNFDVSFSFQAIEVRGTGIVGQIGFSFGVGMVGGSPTYINDTLVSNVEKVIVTAIGSFPWVKTNQCLFRPAGTAAGRSWSGPGEWNAVETVMGVTSGHFNGIDGNPVVVWVGGLLRLENAGFVGQIIATGASISRGTLTISGSRSILSGCFLATIVARNVDILAGVANSLISGCTFSGFTSEAIQIAGTEVVVTGNQNCKVVETGAANSNRYSGNTGFDGVSTIIGALSIIEDQQTRAVSTTPYTVVATDRTILVDATGGARTVNLPTAASAKWRVLKIKKIDSSANTVTVDGSGAETIDGAATQVIAAQYASFTIQSDGATWWIL
jgi:hypothetical protein